MPRPPRSANPRAAKYDPAADQAKAAWEAARQARRSATIALWAVAATVLMGVVATIAPVVSEQVRERQASAAAMDDELDRAGDWVMAGIQVDNDRLAQEIAGKLGAKTVRSSVRDPVLDYQWQKKLLSGRRRLESLATAAPAPADLRNLRRIEALQIEEIQSYVDAVQGRPVGSEEKDITANLDVVSKGLAKAINRIEESRGHALRYADDQWPMVDRYTAARNAPAQLKRWLQENPPSRAAR